MNIYCVYVIQKNHFFFFALYLIARSKVSTIVRISRSKDGNSTMQISI
jgi:hypothetical protein